MIKTIVSLLCALLCLPAFAQNLKLTQQKGKDDFLVQNGHYSIYFHKADVVHTLEEIDKKLKTDNAQFRQAINEGTLKQVDITSQAAADKAAIKMVKSSLGSYLLLKGKATVYKDNQQLHEISIDEAPAEVDLDGTKSNIFFFGEIGTTNWIFNGGIRSELRN